MFTQRDVELIARETCFQGFFRLDRLRLRHRRFSGDWTPELEREVAVRNPAVAVMPYDPIRDAVVLIEQFRVGAYAADRAPWMVEVAAGIVEPGETNEAVAHRELVEEVGLTATSLHRIAEFLPSPGGLSETITLYCARVDAPMAEGMHGLADEGEDIRATRMPADEAIALLDEPGRVANAFTIIALQWLALKRQGLRAQWLGTAGEAAMPGA